MSLSSAALHAQSGLRTVTNEMALVARNITGAGESFYSRKIGKIVTTSDGSGLDSVVRVSNEAVFANVLSSTAAAAAKRTLTAGLDALYHTLGDDSAVATSPAALLASFVRALQAYASTPSDENAARSAVAQAGALTNALNIQSADIQSERVRADGEIAASVENVNSLLVQFEILNTEVVKGTALGADTTDKQDQRDAILQSLAQEIGISTIIGRDGDISIYTDSGVTLFQGGKARAVTFTATETFTAATTANAVYVDGIPVTGNPAAMPIRSGKIAGLASFRDEISVAYQAQLDNIAAALIDAFAEQDQVGTGPDLPGLFTIAGATALPTRISGLAAEISINTSVDPTRGGDVNRLRDGGISAPGNPNYVYNKDGYASYVGRVNEMLESLGSSRQFTATGSLPTATTLENYAVASVSWISETRKKAASEQTYQDTLLNTATSALSNATGVDLDVEMSKMLDLEQSYAATAKLIGAIDGMFDLLLEMT